MPTTPDQVRGDNLMDRALRPSSRRQRRRRYRATSAGGTAGRPPATACREPATHSNHWIAGQARNDSLYGMSLFGSGCDASRGPTEPSRAFSDCGWPEMIAAYIVVFASTFFT